MSKANIPPLGAASGSTLQLGNGRAIKPHDTYELSLYSLPLVGRWLYDILRPSERLTQAGTINPHHLIVGEMGIGKTNYGKFLINQQIQRSLGGFVTDGKEGKDSLGTWTIQRLAEVGWDPEKCFIWDLFSEFGHAMQDILFDDKHDYISWANITSELVDATSVMASTNQGLLDRGKSMARFAWQALLLDDKPASSIIRFLLDRGYQKNVVKRVAQKFDYLELELFWLGYPDFKNPDEYRDAYVDRLPRDVLESTRNK